MDFFSSFCYGLIQGLSEFLPVSSSGHLARLPHVLKIKDPGVFFDLTMHIGTGVAGVLYFRKEVGKILSDFFLFFTGRRKVHEVPLMLNSLISTISSLVIIVLILKFKLNEKVRAPLWIAFNLSIFGVIMFLSDYFSKKTTKNPEKEYLFFDALLIGISQAVAVFPGVSRSGITLTAARALGMNRKNSSRYSFLLSLPIIFGGFFLKLPEVMVSSTPFNWGDCLIGGFFAFFFGIISIHYFLKVIDKIGLWAFSIYRIIIGVFIFLSYQ